MTTLPTTNNGQTSLAETDHYVVATYVGFELYKGTYYEIDELWDAAPDVIETADYNYELVELFDEHLKPDMRTFDRPTPPQEFIDHPNSTIVEVETYCVFDAFGMDFALTDLDVSSLAQLSANGIQLELVESIDDWRDIYEPKK